MSLEEFTTQMSKRVFKEIMRDNLNAELIKNDLYVLLDVNGTTKKRLDSINCCIFLKFNLKNYPWNYPLTTLIINNSNDKYKEIKLNNVYKTNKIFSKEIKRMSGVDCLYCNSFLCDHLWSPTCKIQNIIDEFKNITYLKFRAVERLYCDKIQEQLIKTINNNGLNYLSKEDLRIADYL
tara:strand:+ start:97 stop:633 length:537 start_codon:yes stop_codon:yes gene_type:complete